MTDRPPPWHDRERPPSAWEGNETAFQIATARYGMWTSVNGHPRNRETGEPVTAETAACLMEWHWSESLNRWHGGLVRFANRGGGQDGHQLISSDPLTISPSLLCSCGDHGFLKQGEWRPA